MFSIAFRTCSGVKTLFRIRGINNRIIYSGKVNRSLFTVRTPEEIENSKIVPKGYKIIYYNQDAKWFLPAWLAVVVSLTSGLYYVTLALSVDGIDIEKLKKNKFFVFLLFHGLLLYGFVQRTCMYMFRNGPMYKSVYFGLLGNWRPIIMDHKGVLKSRIDIFHICNNKYVYINPEYFLNMREYYALLSSSLEKKNKLQE